MIDLFAGPGGLGEGFASFADSRGSRRFQIALSIEMNTAAHQTLELRSFFRHLSGREALHDYYEFLRGALSRKDLFKRHGDAAQAAEVETWCFRLGRQPEKVYDRIYNALTARNGPWLLIGGPPCQAYSIAGRSHYRDGRRRWRKQRLYQHYLDIIARFRPTAFIMENVKGLLSSKVGKQPIFQQICNDLANPAAASTADDWPASVNGNGSNGRLQSPDRYRIYSLVGDSLFPEGGDFVICAEKYGIPQRRHRVIILGVRSDVGELPRPLEPQSDVVTVEDVIEGLPPLRSQLSRGRDSFESWVAALQYGLKIGAFDAADPETRAKIRAAIADTRTCQEIGGRFVSGGFPPRRLAKELFRQDLGGVCNHQARAHMQEDLWRYIFTASYAEQHKKSPYLKDFPLRLLPNHQSVADALLTRHGHFSDRFRAQLRDEPATTVTSHIAKDGHYFIHYDAAQCRSLSVREAARLQTFADDYFFEGNRTQQYTQVGNAVPPLLARQLAAVVCPILDAALSQSGPRDFLVERSHV